jgi:transcriptional regulator with XRE-family HTH domain
MYPNLKLQIWKCGFHQNRLAQMVGIHESLLSRIVNGFRQPDALLRLRIAQALKSDEHWLFSTEDAANAPSTVRKKARQARPAASPKRDGTEKAAARE